MDYDYPQKGIGVYARLLEQKRLENTLPKPLQVSPDRTSPPTPLLKGEGSIRDKIQSQTGSICDMALTKEILDTYGINTIGEYLVTDEAEIETVFAQLSGKIVAKISSPDIAHKSDVGGIITDITTLEQARESYATIMNSVQKHCPEAQIDGVIFQTQIASAQEIFV